MSEQVDKRDVSAFRKAMEQEIDLGLRNAGRQEWRTLQGSYRCCECQQCDACYREALYVVRFVQAVERWAA